jgi:hypothetical protein
MFLVCGETMHVLLVQNDWDPISLPISGKPFFFSIKTHVGTLKGLGLVLVHQEEDVPVDHHNLVTI